MANTLRTLVGRTLNVFGLRRVARKIEYALRPKRFRPDSEVTLEAVGRAIEMVTGTGLAEKGDYYEFGIYRGYTLWHAQQVMKRLGNSTMRVVGFDSFQGFPEVQGVDAYKGDFSEGQFAAGLEYVRGMLTEHGIDWERTILVPGFFQDSLSDETKRKHAMKPAAVVLIDCVLYESTKLALAWLCDLLVDGSILVFDDWNAFDRDEDRGERRAFREFLAAHPEWEATELFDYGVYGKAFRVATRVREPA